MASSTTPGGWHRVCLNTIVRKGVNLESERLRILPMGSRVRVVERVDRRVRIDQPIAGWCSLKSSNGDTILTPLDQEEVEARTPGGSKSSYQTKKRYEHDGAAMKQKLEKQEKDVNTLKEEIKDNEKAQELYKISAELETLKRTFAEKKRNEEERTKTQSQIKKTAEQIDAYKIDTLKRQQEIEVLHKQINGLENKMNASNVDEKTQHMVLKIQQMEADKLASERKVRTAEQLANAAKKEMDDMQEQMKTLFAKEAKQEEDDEFEAGDVIMVKRGLGVVVVRFYGLVDGMGDKDKFLGVELSDPIGDTNGTLNGKTYFEVVDDCGLFIRTDEVKKKITPEQLLHQLHAVLRNIQRSKNAKE
eukprot:UN25593